MESVRVLSSSLVITVNLQVIAFLAQSSMEGSLNKSQLCHSKLIGKNRNAQCFLFGSEFDKFEKKISINTSRLTANTANHWLYYFIFYVPIILSPFFTFKIIWLK